MIDLEKALFIIIASVNMYSSFYDCYQLTTATAYIVEVAKRLLDSIPTGIFDDGFMTPKVRFISRLMQFAFEKSEKIVIFSSSLEALEAVTEVLTQVIHGSYPKALYAKFTQYIIPSLSLQRFC